MRVAPADGVNRNVHIKWQCARFAVQAVFEAGKPIHQVIVDYPDPRSETGRSAQGMAVDLDDAGAPEAVATVSGGHEEGMGRLSAEQRLVMSQLIQRSIDAGQIEG